MPDFCRKRIGRIVPSGAVLLALLGGAGGLALLARTEHPGRFLLVAARGGRFVEIGQGVLQTGPNDCGPAALAHCLRELGVPAPYPDPACGVTLTARGCRLDALAEEAGRRGQEARCRRLDPHRIRDVKPPAILHAREGHFLVYEGMDADGRARLHDPAVGRVSYRVASLARRWTGHVLEFRGRPAACGSPGSRGAARPQDPSGRGPGRRKVLNCPRGPHSAAPAGSAGRAARGAPPRALGP